MRELPPSGAWFATVLAFAIMSSWVFSSIAQDAPLDSSEISRDLLYLAPSRAEKRVAGNVINTAYVGTRFEYMRSSETNWFIRAAETKSEPP
jgi:hypothetical protein